MNRIRFSFLIAMAVLAGLVFPQNLRAQTSIQQLNFTLLCEYQTNTFYTNISNTFGDLTNEHSGIKNILIAPHGVLKAIAVDMFGTNWTNWTYGHLVREVNLTNGNEGIFIRTPSGDQTNVSSFFGGTFSNNFMAAITNLFPGSTNNFEPSFQVNRGWIYQTNETGFETNYIRTGGLYALSLNTTNMRINIVAAGDGTITNVYGYMDGTLYERQINTEYIGSAGTFYLNVTTNVFNMGSNPPVYLTGIVRGSISVAQPYFAPIPGP
jgi:hypothetical protein